MKKAGDWKKKTGDRGGWKRLGGETVKKRKRETDKTIQKVTVHEIRQYRIVKTIFNLHSVQSFVVLGPLRTHNTFYTVHIDTVYILQANRLNIGVVQCLVSPMQ